MSCGLNLLSVILTFLCLFKGDSRVRYGPASGYGAGGGGRGGRSISKPRNLRGFRDASGQLVFDPDDENLSDKELYARNIPAIGIFSDKSRSFLHVVCAVLLWPTFFLLLLNSFL